MHIFYRISNNSYDKPKLENASKEDCFLNFLKAVLIPSDTLIVIADGVNEALMTFLQAQMPANGQIMPTATGSNSASFQLQIELAKALPRETLVLLQEDDYLYLPHPTDSADAKWVHHLYEEGVSKADYVSLYDHPDKYVPYSKTGNPAIGDDGVEHTGVFLTKHSHWKFTNSTTLTFAIAAGTLVEDAQIWQKWSQGPHPRDYNAFIECLAKGRKIATSLPGRSAHAVPGYLSPFIDWRALA